jgi:hypothetical protein
MAREVWKKLEELVITGPSEDRQPKTLFPSRLARSTDSVRSVLKKHGQKPDNFDVNGKREFA